MLIKQDLTTFTQPIFYPLIYPILSQEFLVGESYDKFSSLVYDRFKLTEKQWGEVLEAWESKEEILN